MKYTKKMALVDPRILEHLQSQSHVSENPIETKAFELDQEMKAILNQSHLASKEKLVMYNDVLQKYLYFNDKLTQGSSAAPPPPSSPPATPEKKVETPSAPPLEEEEAAAAADIAGTFSVVDATPKPYKNKAKVLLKYLEQNKNVAWSKNGELIYNGKIVPHTHVVDLVQDTLRKRKTHTPHGWKTFASALKESNVPRDVIGNLDRWEWIQKPDTDEKVPTSLKKSDRIRSNSKVLHKFRWKPY